MASGDLGSVPSFHLDRPGAALSTGLTAWTARGTAHLWRRAGWWSRRASAGGCAVEDLEGVGDAGDVEGPPERGGALPERRPGRLGEQAAADQLVHRLGDAQTAPATQGRDGP